MPFFFLNYSYNCEQRLRAPWSSLSLSLVCLKRRRANGQRTAMAHTDVQDPVCKCTGAQHPAAVGFGLPTRFFPPYGLQRRKKEFVITRYSYSKKKNMRKKTIPHDFYYFRFVSRGARTAVIVKTRLDLVPLYGGAGEAFFFLSSSDFGVPLMLLPRLFLGCCHLLTRVRCEPLRDASGTHCCHPRHDDGVMFCASRTDSSRA